MDKRDQSAIGSKPKRPCQPPKNEPTQDEIRERAAAIRAEWSVAEEARRRVPDRPVDMTVVHRVVEGEE